MGRRISDSDPNGKTPCAFCRTMRVVVLFALVVVALMAYANKLEWLKHINFTSLFGYSVVLLFVIVLSYRIWDEYVRPKQSDADKAAKIARREELFDALDAQEAIQAQELTDVQEPSLEPRSNQFSTAPEQLDLLGFSIPKKPD